MQNCSQSAYIQVDVTRLRRTVRSERSKIFLKSWCGACVCWDGDVCVPNRDILHQGPLHEKSIVQLILNLESSTSWYRFLLCSGIGNATWAGHHSKLRKSSSHIQTQQFCKLQHVSRVFAPKVIQNSMFSVRLFCHRIGWHLMRGAHVHPQPVASELVMTDRASE